MGLQRHAFDVGWVERQESPRGLARLFFKTVTCMLLALAGAMLSYLAMFEMVPRGRCGVSGAQVILAPAFAAEMLVVVLCSFDRENGLGGLVLRLSRAVAIGCLIAPFAWVYVVFA